MDTLSRLLKKFPKREWDYSALSGNVNLDFQFVLDNLDLSWDWFKLSRFHYRHFYHNSHLPLWDFWALSYHIDFEYVKANLHFGWDYTQLSRNTGIDFEFVKKNVNLPWNWQVLSSNPKIDLEFVKKNLHLHWNWQGVSYNPGISFEFVKENLHLPWDWEDLSENKALTFDFVKKNMKLPWNYGFMCGNPTLEFSFVLAHPDFLWDWQELSSNVCLDFNYIEQNMAFFWEYTYELCWNPTLTFEFIKKTDSDGHYSVGSHLPWKSKHCIRILHDHPGLTFDFVKDNLNWPWDWSKLSRLIDFSFILHHLELPWKWENVSSNETLSYDIQKSLGILPRYQQMYLQKKNMYLNKRKKTRSKFTMD